MRYVDELGETERLLFEPVGPLWTEHSEKATIRTWAEAAQVPEEIRKKMGRWTPSVGQAYERTERVNVLRAQARIAAFVKEHIGRHDVFDEAMIFAVMTERMDRLGFPTEAVQDHVSRLATFGMDGPPTKVRVKGVEVTINDEAAVDAAAADGEELAEGEQAEEEREAEPPRVDSPGEEDEDLPGSVGATKTVPRGTYVVSHEANTAPSWGVPPYPRCALQCVRGFGK